jgi:hypothetical protein
VVGETYKPDAGSVCKLELAAKVGKTEEKPLQSLILGSKISD